MTIWKLILTYYPYDKLDLESDPYNNNLEADNLEDISPDINILEDQEMNYDFLNAHLYNQY